MMRLLILISQYPPSGRGGMERLTQRFAQALGSRGHSVLIVTQHVPGLPRIEQEAKGVEVRRTLKPIPIGPLWGLTYMMGVAREMMLTRNRWDLVLSQSLYLHAVIARRISRSLGKRCVVRLANAGMQSEIDSLGSHRGGRKFVQQALESDAFLALSNEIRQELITAGVDEYRVWPFRNYVDTDHFSPGGKPQPGLFLYMGRFVTQKNVVGLVHSFCRIAENHRDTRLLIVGEGPEEAAIRETCQSCGFESRIEIRPWVEDPVSLYRQAWAVVTATRAEGMSNVVLEAMSCGTPVITPDVSGACEILGTATGFKEDVLEGSGGLIVRSDDKNALAHAMSRLLNNTDKRHELGQKACRRIEERFCEDVCLTEFFRMSEAIT